LDVVTPDVPERAGKTERPYAVQASQCYKRRPMPIKRADEEEWPFDCEAPRKPSKDGFRDGAFGLDNPAILAHNIAVPRAREVIDAR